MFTTIRHRVWRGIFKELEDEFDEEKDGIEEEIDEGLQGNFDEDGEGLETGEDDPEMA
jgi:hypothetical protein